MKSRQKFRETEIGQIPDDWEVKRIGEVVRINELVIDKSFKYKEIEYIDTSSVDRGRILRTVKFSVDKAPSRAQRILRKNDIIISSVRPNLKHFAFIKEAKPNTIASTGFVVISSKKINPHFLYYYLTTDKYIDYLASIADAHTSAYPAFNPDVIEESNVPFPPEIEQKLIAKILSDLDDKIEINQQMNKTLEMIGQSIFKYWFIDFEFPNDKGEPYKSSGGKLVDSELGFTPKGWEVKSLGDFISLERGLSYKGKGLCNSGIPMVNLGNMAPNCGFLYNGLKYYSGEFKERNLIRPGDIVVANSDITQKRDVLGSPAIVPSDLGSDKILFTHHIFAVRNKSKLHNFFIYYLLQLKKYKDRVRGFAIGTSILALPEDTILDFKFAVPDKAILTKFVELVNNLRNKINNNNIQNTELSQIRDSLLPKLVSGKIRVPIEVKK